MNSSFSKATDIAKVLVVDDDPALLRSTQQLLESNHFEVVAVSSGEAACKVLLDMPVELVLLDVHMSGMDGHSVLDFISEHHINVATVMVSGEASFSSAAKALRRGAYDYLKKPYAPEQLISVLERAKQKILLEQAHESMQKRLKKSEELHRFIVNSSPDIVFMVDGRGHFTFINNKIESLLGYKKKEIIGMHYNDIVHESDRERADYIFKITPNNTNEWHSELKLRPKNNSHSSRYFEVTLFPIESTHPNKKSSEVAGIYGTARDIMERKEAEEFINFQAYHDMLTRLPNRALFKDRLSLAVNQAKRNRSDVAVMFLDLDRFKIVNDSLGHAMGDRMLQSVAQRLEGCIRKGDTLARFGGDEFTLLLPDIGCQEDATTIAKKIIQALKSPFDLNGHQAYVGVSIGISTLSLSGDQFDDLIQNADTAMYHVKGSGKDGYQFYNESMLHKSLQRLSMERDIHNALDEQQFEVFYQPKVDANSHRIVGVEALIRWMHPQRGMIMPNEFIALAEETNMMNDISQWVLKRSCSDMKRWFQDGHTDLTLSVNISASQIEHPRFVPQLLKNLAELEFPPNRLELELTENIIMSDLDSIAKKCCALAEHGVSIAIDDFGTGYSSLNYLRQLPIDTLKVDRSFIHDIQEHEEEACIVNAIISMAHGLKLNIVAEGVETEEQLMYLQQLGCHEIQGFYFGKAQPFDVTSRILNEDSAKMAV